MTSFKTTTPRSARIGQEGHSTDKDWIHFTEKYRPPCMKFLDRHYPKYRFLKDDVYEDMVVMILDNPGFANRKPSVRFRTVLIKLLRKAMASAVRKLREESGERYARLMQPLLPAETAFDCDRRRLQLIAVDFIRRDLLREDYPNGRFFAEYNSRDLRIWRERNRDGATCESVAATTGWSAATVSTACANIEARVERDAAALMAAAGLL